MSSVFRSARAACLGLLFSAGIGCDGCRAATEAPAEGPPAATQPAQPAAQSAARPTGAPRAAATPGRAAAGPAADPVAYQGALPARSGFGNLSVGGQSRRVFVHAPASMPANPPLVVLLHGTGANESDGALDGALGEMDARSVADAGGFLLVAPFSTSDGGANADHEDGGVGWRFDGDANSNRDLLLVRAVIQEARKSHRVDASRVYLVGHSNGAFFSYFAAMKLADRVAAFAENSGGLIPCGRRVDCTHVASGATSCARVLAAAPASCRCPVDPRAFPALKPAGRVPPGFLKHNADDSTVSAVFTCRLAEHLGGQAQVVIDPTGEHGPTNDFFTKAWAFLSTHTLAP